MELLIAIFLIGAAAAYLTSIPCRALYGRHRRPYWVLGLAGAVGAGILTVLTVYQGDVFHPDQWDRGKMSLQILMSMFFGFSTAIGLIPALLVVRYYRGKLRGEMPEA